MASASKDGTAVSYTYDVAGIRDSKTVNGVTYNYITQNGQVVRQSWTENGTSHVMDFIYDTNGRPYAMVYDGDLYYYLLDQRGDVVIITDENGLTAARYGYDAWGNVIYAVGSMTEINPLRYRGYYYDSESGLYYLQSRYYDPTMKRFVNADGYMSTGQGSLGYNMFAYCNNCPVNRIELQGFFSQDATLAATGLSWIALLDGPLPIGDIFFIASSAVVALGILSAANTSDLPNQGAVSELPDAPDVDAGKQGKHVPGHPNNDTSKSQWEEGETGVKATQEAWQTGNSVKPDGSVKIGTSSDGRRIKVHIDRRGRIHGYPIPNIR